MNTQNNKDLRKAFGMFPTGITVVTAIDKDNKPIGGKWSFDEENRKKIYHELRKELRKDRAKVAVSPITEFGLLEMTRQRIRVSLLDSMSEECPSCFGSGRIISKEALITRIEHWLRRYKSKHRDLRIILQLHEENAHYIENDKKNILRGLMWKNFVHIKIESNKDLRRDEFRFVKSRSGKDITNEMSLDKDA